MSRAVRDWVSCSLAAVPMSASAVARVTIRPVDTDISRAGIWVTRPSPIGEQAEPVDRVAGGHAHLQHADREPAEQVDDGDDDAGDRVALDELRATVHRAVEVRLGGDLLASPARLVLVDQAGVEVGVDGHLLAGHRVEGEARAHLGDPAGTVGDHDELDDDQDEEDHQADDQRPAHHEVPERVDDVPGVAVAQHQPGGGDVEGQPEQGEHQQQRGEHREVQRLHHVHAGQQHDEGQRDVQHDEQVEHRGGQRHHEQQHDADHAGRDGQLAEVDELHRVPPVARGRAVGSVMPPPPRGSTGRPGRGARPGRSRGGAAP